LRASTTHVLIVDDYEPWRQFLFSTLQKNPEFRVIGQVADGLEAVEKAQELQPDLILLDIGLPKLHGIEAARRIRGLSPNARILFITENSCPDIASEALRTGAYGYLVKSAAASELWPAITAVLHGKPFISDRLAASVDIVANTANGPADKNLVAKSARQHAEITTRHEVEFYPDDAAFVEGFAGSIEAALKMGDAVILIASESHRAGILKRLRADGVDVRFAVKEGSYIALAPAEALATIMQEDMPDPVRCSKLVDNLITDAKGPEGRHRRVGLFGECAPTLLADGNVDAALRLEHLWDEMMKRHDAYTLCGYLWSAFPDREDSTVFLRICAEHSAVHGV
jgi:DNA-binding NarL/FixJ family response regulator